MAKCRICGGKAYAHYFEGILVSIGKRKSDKQGWFCGLHDPFEDKAKERKLRRRQ